MGNGNLRVFISLEINDGIATLVILLSWAQGPGPGQEPLLSEACVCILLAEMNRDSIFGGWVGGVRD